MALALIAATPCAHALPSFDEVRADFRPSDTLILDRQGELVQRLRTDASVRRGQWVGLAEVSPALRTALVLSEDQRFYEHSGVDWRAVSAAAWGNVWNSRTRGASTLTMQLAGLLDGDWRAGAGGRSVVQKLGQTVAAQVLERRWRKDQVLEAYLNLVPFRGELVGLDAMSRTLFGKAAHGLDEREAAVAVALVRAPNASPAKVAQRACGVLRALQAPAPTSAKPASPPVAADCTGLDSYVGNALQRRDYSASQGVAPHWARRVLAQSRSAATGTSAITSTSAAGSLRSSLSAPLQRFALDTLQRHLRELQGRNVEDGALVVLDNASGEVLAWVGSSGELSDAAEVDGVLAARQPGSTLKPLLYAQALAEQRLTAASLLNDAPAQLATANGLYIPQNYDHQFKGWVSARTALAASLNVPAVRTLVMVSPEAFARQLRALGLPLKETGDFYGYSLALGSAEVPLLALTNAYRALANGGRYSPVAPALFSRPASASPAAATATTTVAIDPRAAFVIGDILSDANARVRTFGPDSVLATRFWTAVKTGTSKDMRDNWAVGWSARYTVGVWVGNASGDAMHDVSGTSGAAPIWAAVMQYLHRNTPSRAPTPPAGLIRQRVQFGPTGAGPNSPALEAARDEWFLPGTAQAQFNLPPAATNNNPGRITAPANGTILALDPDIPPSRQRVQLSSDQPNARWSIDGKPLPAPASHANHRSAASEPSNTAWLPWPGRHRIALLDANGQVLDEVRVEVRGAGVKATAK